jgi:predicted ATPase
VRLLYCLTVHRELQMSTSPVPAGDPDLPLDVTPFVGRTREVSQIVAALSQPECSPVFVTGPPGIGKSRLAREVAIQLYDTFCGETHLVSLPRDMEGELVPAEIETCLGLECSSGISPEIRILDALSGRRALLVLDDMSAGAWAFVRSILTACPEVGVLATGRQVPDAGDIRVVHLAGLDVPDCRTPSWESLPPAESIELLLARVHMLAPETTLAEERIVPIVVCCAGVPLALEIAASDLAGNGFEGVNASASSVSCAAFGNPSDPESALWNVVGWSYGRLDESSKRLFARMAVFAGACTLDALETVCNQDFTVDVFERIEVLMHAGLALQVGTEEPRFVLPGGVREHALALLTESGEAAEVRDVHASYFASLAGDAESRRNGQTPVSGAERLRTHRADLRQALRWSLVHGDPTPGSRLALALLPCWSADGAFVEAGFWLHLALRRGDEIDPELWARCLEGAAQLASKTGDWDSAVRLLEECLSLRRAHAHAGPVAASLAGLGEALRVVGDFVASDQRFRESLALSEESGDRRNAGLALNGLGANELVRRDYPRAYSYFEAALTAHRELGNVNGAGRSLIGLAAAAYHQHEYARAESLYEQALRLSGETGEAGVHSQALWGLGASAASQRKVEPAARFLAAAVHFTETSRVTIEPAEQLWHDAILELARQNLDGDTWDRIRRGEYVALPVRGLEEQCGQVAGSSRLHTVHIEIDHSWKKAEVDSITESDTFLQVMQQARELRKRRAVTE